VDVKVEQRRLAICKKGYRIASSRLRPKMYDIGDIPLSLSLSLSLLSLVDVAYVNVNEAHSG